MDGLLRVSAYFQFSLLPFLRKFFCMCMYEFMHVILYVCLCGHLQSRQTALVAAVCEGRLNVVEFLVKQGANLLVQDSEVKIIIKQRHIQRLNI